MNIGATSMDAPARMAAGALSRSLDVQADAVGKLMGGATGQNGDQMVQAAMAEQGKGQKLNITVWRSPPGGPSAPPDSESWSAL